MNDKNRDHRYINYPEKNTHTHSDRTISTFENFPTIFMFFFHPIFQIDLAKKKKDLPK